MTASTQTDAGAENLPPPPAVPHTLKVLLRICFGIGGLLVAVALVLAVREWRFIATSEHATATVSRIGREWMSGSSSNGSRRNGNWGYRIIATFPASDGRSFEARSPSLTSYTGYRVGDRIGVDYPPGRPERAQLVRFVDRWMLALVFGGIGAVTMAIGGFAVWLLKQPGTRITSNGIGGFGIQSARFTVEDPRREPSEQTAAAPTTPPRAATMRRAPARFGWQWIALVLVAGIGIGLLVARGRDHRASVGDTPQPTTGFAEPAAAGDAPRPGYASRLTVKAPAMPDSSDTAWTSPANGGATVANLTMAARAFVAHPEQDAAMQAALRGQVARLGLECPGITFVPGETLLLAAPPPVFDEHGLMQRGLIRQRFMAQACPGRSPEFNIWLFAAGDGAPIRIVAGFPGTTRADLPLLKDATPIVLAMASRLAPGCPTLAVSDTHLPGPSPRDVAASWSEEWLVTGCGKRIALTVRFIPDPARGGTRIEVPDTLARLLTPS